jgi:hypothetical protein
MKRTWDKEILLCECHSDEHQMLIFYNEEEYVTGEKYNICYAHVHLSTYESFWKRVVHGVKFMFGYKSKYGAWDEFIFSPDDADKLQELVNYLKKQKDDEENISR